MQFIPDPTFYPSPRLAMQAGAERLAYVAVLNPAGDGRPDRLAVVDVDRGSPSYGRNVGGVEMTQPGDELHHFGWNACSSALCPYAPHPHIERRYLVVPGLRSSRIHIVDTKPDPRNPQIVKVIEPEEVMQQDRLRRAAHGALRAGRHLHERARRSGRRRTRRHLHARPRDVRRAGRAGRRTAGRSTWRTTSGGTWATTR